MTALRQTYLSAVLSCVACTNSANGASDQVPRGKGTVPGDSESAPTHVEAGADPDQENADLAPTNTAGRHVDARAPVRIDAASPSASTDTERPSTMPFDASGGDSGSPSSRGVRPQTPSVEWSILVTIDGTSSSMISRHSVAGRADEGAVSYIERVTLQDGTVERRVRLQRFDSTGVAIGAPLLLADGLAEEQWFATPSLAADDEHYLVCAPSPASDERVTCAALDGENNVAPGVFEAVGSYPAVAHAAETWVVAYRTSDGGIELQALSTKLEPVGDAVRFDISNFADVGSQAPLVVGTETGFALVAATSPDGPAHLFRLDTDLTPTADPTPLGRDFWHVASLAAADSRAAVSLGRPYESSLLLIEDDRIVWDVTIDGGGKTGNYQPVLATSGALVAAWFDDPAPNPPAALTAPPRPSFTLNTLLLDDPPAVTNSASEHYLELVRVGSRVLLVAAVRYTTPATIEVAVIPH